MLSHNNLLTNADAAGKMLANGQDVIQLSRLPYSHIYARTCDHYATMFLGAILCLAESMETILADFNAVGATRMNSVPRFYDKVWASVERFSPEERRRRLKRSPSARDPECSTSGGGPLPHTGRDRLQRGGPDPPRRLRPDRVVAGHQLQ